MNERIKQLAEQCYVYNDKTDDIWFNKEKFAELIVKESADVIQKEVSMKYKDGGETEEFMAGHYAGSVLARVMIRKHFGVEE
jgi:hypothetical protein